MYFAAKGVNLGGRAQIEEKHVCKVVGAIEFLNLEHDICSAKIRIKWWVYLHRLGFAVYFAIGADTLKF